MASNFIDETSHCKCHDLSFPAIADGFTLYIRFFMSPPEKASVLSHAMQTFICGKKKARQYAYP